MIPSTQRTTALPALPALPALTALPAPTAPTVPTVPTVPTDGRSIEAEPSQPPQYSFARILGTWAAAAHSVQSVVFAILVLILVLR